jgi:hypothetical protein
LALFSLPSMGRAGSGAPALSRPWKWNEPQHHPTQTLPIRGRVPNADYRVSPAADRAVDPRDQLSDSGPGSACVHSSSRRFLTPTSIDWRTALAVPALGFCPVRRQACGSRRRARSPASRGSSRNGRSIALVNARLHRADPMMPTPFARAAAIAARGCRPVQTSERPADRWWRCIAPRRRGRRAAG